MDAACRVKSDRGYTVAAIDNLEEEFGLFLTGSRSRVAPTRHSDDLSLQETGDLTFRCKIFSGGRGSA